MENESGEFVIKGDHHIGFACDTPVGLMVPVVRNVEQKSILHIAAELQDLFERTREGKAERHELGGSTFTITGVGNIGGGARDAHPQPPRGGHPRRQPDQEAPGRRSRTMRSWCAR